MISVTDLRKVYRQPGRDIHALGGVTLSVPARTVHGVVGPSGAGKSTLVRCLALLDRPTSGSVDIGGTDLASAHRTALRDARRRLGVVFQHANLFDSRTVAGNVSYPLELAAVPRVERVAKVAELLRLVGLGDYGTAFPAHLSGGQRQRVGIARALATGPDALLFDEPTSALDPGTTDEILDLIARLTDELGLAVLIITHDMHVVKRICDSVSLLERGVIVESGSLAQVVGTFGGPLSEALLGLPPLTVEQRSAGTIVEVLDTTAPGGLGALTTIERRHDLHLSVLAATVEKLGDATYHRLRLAVPSTNDARIAVELFEREGARAAVAGVAA
jgi:D-methionine transport system ATP-binding protein